MKGSGIRECLQMVYGENLINHTLPGKVVSWALRAHCLLQSSLMSKIITLLMNKRILSHLNITAMESLHKSFVKNKIFFEEFVQSEMLRKFNNAIEKNEAPWTDIAYCRIVDLVYTLHQHSKALHCCWKNEKLGKLSIIFCWNTKLACSYGSPYLRKKCLVVPLDFSWASIFIPWSVRKFYQQGIYIMWFVVAIDFEEGYGWILQWNRC